MATSAPTTPFPIGSHRSKGGGEATPAELLAFLETLITENLHEDSTERIAATARESWSTIIEGLSEHFLVAFPKPRSVLWSTLHEKVNLCKASLTVIERAALRVDALMVGTDRLSSLLLDRMFNLLFSLQSWSCCPIPQSDEFDGPSALRRKLVETLGCVLNVMGLCTPQSKIMDEMSRKCLKSINDILHQLRNGTLPLQLNWIDILMQEEMIENNVDIDQAMAYLALTDLFDIATTCFAVMKRQNGTFLIDERIFVIAGNNLLEFLLESAPGVVRLQRSEALATLVQAISRLHSLVSGGRDVLRSLLSTLLLFRLRDASTTEWQLVDCALRDCYTTGTMPLHPQNTASFVLELMLREDQQGMRELQDATISAIQASLIGLEKRDREPLHVILCNRSSVEPFASLLKSLNEVSEPQEDLVAETIVGKRKRTNEYWKKRVLDVLHTDIFNDGDTCKPHDEANNAIWITSVLEDLRRKLGRPLLNVDSSSRIKAINALKLVACIIAHPEVEECRRLDMQDHPPILALIPTYVTCLSYLHEGPREEVNSAVSRSVQDALAICLRHHTQGASEEKLDAALELIRQGMQDQDRSTRIASGRALVEYLHLHRRIGLGRCVNRRLNSVFLVVNSLLSHARDTTKETTLITLGSLGRVEDAGVLGKVLHILITHLDQSSILLRGVAYLQLVGLAKFYKKTPYLLVSPFLEEISAHIVSIMPQRPNATLETCRFLSLSPGDFLSITLPYTLPRLFGECNISALDGIHKELGKSISSLFLNSSADILAHVFMLKKPAKTDKALSFVLRTLSEAANNAKIGLGNVVKSCIVPLLGRLVISMGDEDKEIAEDAVSAIHKVERVLGFSSQNQQNDTRRVGSFLNGYMLGIIALLNDILQDVQGRKTDDMKRKVVLGLNALIKEVGSSVSSVAPQIMATLQSTVTLQQLSHAALQTWHSFILTLSLKDLGPHVGPTTAAIVSLWPILKADEKAFATRIVHYILNDAFSELGVHVDDIADLSSVPELQKGADRLRTVRQAASVKDQLERILDRTYSGNNIVVAQALEELKVFMLGKSSEFLQNLTSGDTFDPLVGHVMKTLLTVACKDGDNIEMIRLLVFDCLGILGAADPDRFDIPYPDDDMVVLDNFRTETEAMQFASHLIEHTLVGAFRSTSDLKYQSHLAFAIQELLKFCKFTPGLVIPGASVPIKVRNRWSALPKHVLETVTPLLEGKFAVNNVSPIVNVQHPIYPTQSTYREWLQLWTAFLISQVQGDTAKTIFNAFRLAIRNKDAGVAHQLLPHLVLNILISGDQDTKEKVGDEITSVLQDQLDESSNSTPDKRLLSAQAIFMLMDHVNKWIRLVRRRDNQKRSERKRATHNPGLTEAEDEVTAVDSILGLEKIDQNLVAQAAFQCKSYARSLMGFEKHIVRQRESNKSQEDLQHYYDKLHEIYSHLDEPDGMEGISTLIRSPSIEHQIRQHESTGRWTSAQSCWEVRLQQSPDNLDYHLGLLRCLRNLGHYDSLRTHIQGILVRNPHWEDSLVGFRVEGAWMNGDWDEVNRLVVEQGDSWEMAIARLLLAVNNSDDEEFSSRLSATRLQLGIPIIAAGDRGYRRAYDALLKLHLVYDIEMIRNGMKLVRKGEPNNNLLSTLFPMLSRRLDSTLPTFRTREPILSVHRTAFSLSRVGEASFKQAIGRAWLDSSKVARKAGHWQTAYSAILQAQECRAPLTYFQSAKLVEASGEPLRALHELNNALKTSRERRLSPNQDVVDLADDSQTGYEERRRGEAKVFTTVNSVQSMEKKLMSEQASLLRAKWMRESGRFDSSTVAQELLELTRNLPNFESAHFYAGHFQDECFMALSPSDKRSTRGPKMNLYTVRSYAAAIRLGSKYAYQTIPRLLTIWLDMGEDEAFTTGDIFGQINEEVKRAINSTPPYKWMTAFPQIVSRVEHKNNQAFATLSLLISTVLQEYPQQGLWMFVSVVKSRQSKREKRGKAILEQLRNNPKNARSQLPLLIDSAIAMSTELLRLCDHAIHNDAVRTLSMSRDFPCLSRLAPSRLIVPLQDTMIVSLPATSGSESSHQPFPVDAPTIAKFFDEIDVMRSLAKPRKITLQGSDGKVYMFLGKPKDDLRKDARLMDFNSIINKLLRTNSESRRRRLRIRTYGVVTLNEECGFIQWVPNTIPIRIVLLKYYGARGIESWNRGMMTTFQEIKAANDKEAAKIFQEKVLKRIPPCFHEWFLDTFPEPTTWLSSRLAYGRTLAVMSMIGFIIGLGDRHLENILLDVNSGDIVHVDFNCLFEKGKNLEVPERVPFRLTQNLTDALGVTSYEGVFRIASEISLQLLRDNKDVLMSVLDAFIHDPLVEWEDEKRKMERQARKMGDINAVKGSTDLKKLARNALTGIERKLRGMFVKENNRNDRKDKEISTSNLVQMLIEEATDPQNLARMYPGWAPWH